jgi:hypothetical protein
MRATDDILVEGLSRRDAKIKMFVKFEKLCPDKVDPDPRAIQFRHPKYCVAVGRYLKPIEHALYRMRGDGKDLPATRLIGKGLSQRERAVLLKSKLELFENPVIMSLDASRFDQHVSRELLRIEHWMYLQCIPSDEFARLLSWQLDNMGVSSRGIRYRTKGKRMSGDMNTALGNCLLMVLMVSTFMRGRKYDILDDGDDCLLVVEHYDAQWVKENVHAAFLEYGMEIKIENVAHSLEEVEWCQCKPIEYAPGEHKFVRNPRKVFAALGGAKYLEPSRKARARLVNTIGLCELVLNLGVPVLQEYALALMRNAGTDAVLQFDEVDSMYYRVHRELRALNMKQLRKRDPQPVTDEARLSYMRAFGVSVQDQLAQEAWLRSWRFSLLGDDFLAEDMDVSTWTRANPFSQEVYPMGE